MKCPKCGNKSLKFKERKFEHQTYKWLECECGYKKQISWFHQHHSFNKNNAKNSI